MLHPHKRRLLLHPTKTYLIIGLLQSGHSIASDCGVGELGGQQLQGVLHIHWPPLTQQLQSLLGLLGKVPVHTLEELCQSLQQEEGEEEGEEEKEVFDLCSSECAAETTGEDTYLLLRGEVVPELPHQVLFFRGQLLGRRVAHNYLLVLRNQQSFSNSVRPNWSHVECLINYWKGSLEILSVQGKVRS